MSADNVTEFGNDEGVYDIADIAISIATLALAKKIYAKEINPSEITSVEQLSAIVQKLGRTHEDAFEIHIERVSDDVKLIRYCIDQAEHSSAIVLLFTLLESQINSVIRILLRIRSYSHGAISDALKGTDFSTKLNVLLPLLGAAPLPRMRQIALQCKTVRNMIVHNKATPDVYADAGDRPGDYETIRERTRKFFEVHSLDQIERDIQTFVDSSVSSNEEVKQAWSLLSDSGLTHRSKK
ncbi:MAG TPA: hypothetical protein VK138_09400 [Acidiferrobacterales bacterium]|nr:hypothetical protein [Acidiferrobacterales bacterium]